MKLAQITNPALGPELQGLLNSPDAGAGFFGELIPNLTGLGFVIGVVIFFFVFMLGAIGWMLSGGDKAKVEEARSRITSAFVGLVILFASFAIIGVVENFFGVNILTLDIGVLKIQ